MTLQYFTFFSGIAHPTARGDRRRQEILDGDFFNFGISNALSAILKSDTRVRQGLWAGLLDASPAVTASPPPPIDPT